MSVASFKVLLWVRTRRFLPVHAHQQHSAEKKRKEGGKQKEKSYVISGKNASHQGYGPHRLNYPCANHVSILIFCSPVLLMPTFGVVLYSVSL